ncbi:hypothetical protein M569_14592, partial [Genlisea aurea]
TSWDHIKNLLTCKQIAASQIHHPTPTLICSDICSVREAVHTSSRVVHRADNSPENSTEAKLISKPRPNGGGGGGSGYSHRGMQLRRLSGCYECHAIVDPARYHVARPTICVCSECGEIFPKIESLEHHRAVRHAVCELGADDSSRNIVEIIFKSSWLMKDNPICKIERILKVQNTQRTIQRFEDYRDAVKIRATARARKDARCAADGNELLRFRGASLACALGSRGSTSLCSGGASCGVCTIIRHGFQGSKFAGIRTTASSGRAHDCVLVGGESEARRAMLVCRVIAGRVQRAAEGGEDEEQQDGGAAEGKNYDSVASVAGVYSNLEELFVFSSRAILPCFVVIYKSMEA